jgi:hypothetical protein
LIEKFVEEWESGFKVVYGVRKKRPEAKWLNGLRRLFYRFIDMISEDSLPYDAGDFRLVDRVILDQVKKINDSSPYLRGTIAAMGFDQKGVQYDRAERRAGSSKFKWRNLFGLAMDGILNHSILPLRISFYFGMAIVLLTVAGLVVYLGGRLFFGQDWPQGFATTTLLMLLSISLNALFLGVIGEYLGRIYRQIKGQPLVIIERRIDNNPTTD